MKESPWRWRPAEWDASLYPLARRAVKGRAAESSVGHAQPEPRFVGGIAHGLDPRRSFEGASEHAGRRARLLDAEPT